MSELEIGNKVKVIGPSIEGWKGNIGHVFTIYQTFKNFQGIELYTNGQEYNYPASSLQLIPNLKENDWVEIIGQPMRVLQTYPTGKIAQIGKYNSKDGEFLVDGWFYEASALRKLTSNEIEEHLKSELKIDDWVEIVKTGVISTGKIAKVIRVDSHSSTPYTIRLDDKSWWQPKSLRKLTPEEIAQRIAQPNWYHCKGCLQMNQMNERLVSIENRLDAGSKVTRQLIDTQEKQQRQLDILEGETSEVIDDRGRIRCPNAQYAPSNNCMFCGDGFELCHDKLVNKKCPMTDVKELYS
jgi:hypothetical protein